MKLTNLLSWLNIAVASASLCVIESPSYAAQNDPTFHYAISTLKQNAIGTWYLDNGADPISGVLSACKGSVPIFVVYGLPNKDCAAGYSNSGQNSNSDQYEQWVNKLVNAVGDTEVIYIVEPDAVGLISQQKCAVEFNYQANLETAVKLLSKNANAHIYVDVASWATQSVAIPLLTSLKSAGRVSGIAINTSNYQSTAAMLTMCETYSSATGGLHCVIDTSRNFNGSPQNEWCNAHSAGIGAPPTDQTGSAIVDYYLWLKVPGESDGQCTYDGRSSDATAGPGAGQFFPDAFKSLWDQGYYVAQGAPKIGQTSGSSQTYSPSPTTPCASQTTAPPAPTNAPTTATPTITEAPTSPTNSPPTATPTTTPTPTTTTTSSTKPPATVAVPATPKPTFEGDESESESDDSEPCEIDESYFAIATPNEDTTDSVTKPYSEPETYSDFTQDQGSGATNYAQNLAAVASPETNDPSTLTPGLTVFIALAAVASIAITALTVFIIRRRKKRQNKENEDRIVAIDSTGIAVLMSTPAAQL